MASLQKYRFIRQYATDDARVWRQRVGKALASRRHPYKPGLVGRRKQTTGSGHVYTDIWDSYQVMDTVNVILKACVHRSIAPLHLPHMHYLHGHCYGDRWIEKFSAQELVWTLIQVTYKCRIFLYTVHATHFLALKRLYSLRARARVVIVREFEDRGRLRIIMQRIMTT